MNFRNHLVAALMMVALVVVAIGCGSGDRNEAVAELESDRQQLSRAAETAARNLGTQLEAAQDANRELNVQLRMQAAQLTSMQAELNRLREATGMSRSVDERRAAEGQRSSGPGFFTYLLLLILLIVIVLVLYRLLKPKPFEDDEDDDFSSFDDDFGFDDEEDELADEDGDEKKGEDKK